MPPPPFITPELAVLIDDMHAHSPPTMEQLEQWNTKQQDHIKQQVAIAEAKEAKEGARENHLMSPEALQKRRAREEKKAAQAARLAQAVIIPDELGDILVPEPTSNAEATAIPQAKQAPNTDTKNTSIAHTIIIPAASSSLDWYNPNALCSYSTIGAAKAAGIWSFPSTLQERAKCGVFRSLWEQGYFMGGGIKFGGDYLVYPGSVFIL